LYDQSQGFVLVTYIEMLQQRSTVAQWSACPPPVSRFVGSIHPDVAIFAPSFHGGLGHLSTPLNTADGCLLGGRVVSVATLPVMVSRLGWGSWFKSDPRLNAAGSLIKPVRDPWNLAGWVTPRQSRSHLEDTSTLPVSLTDLWRQHGGPGHTP